MRRMHGSEGAGAQQCAPATRHGNAQATQVKLLYHQTELLAAPQ